MVTSCKCTGKTIVLTSLMMMCELILLFQEYWTMNQDVKPSA